MTEDVLAWGDERPRRGAGSIVTGVVLVALLGAGIAGALRSRGPERRAEPEPTPSPSGSVSGVGLVDDPFARFVSEHRPDPGLPTPLLVEGGVPAWLVDVGGVVRAYEAIGGPAHAPVLLGWCPVDGTFQDASGTYRYFGHAPAGSVGGRPLTERAVRPSATRPDHVDVGVGTVPTLTDEAATVDERCRGELVHPSLPGVASFLGATATAYGRMTGRYLVTHETRAFCPTYAPRGCATAGWEQYGGDSVLPPGDLASSYTWEGEFLVHAEAATGDLSVVITPDARLVRREHVGAAVRVGWAESAYERDGVVHLRFNAFRHDEAGLPDDSPSGPPGMPVDRYRRFLLDFSGGLRDYAVAPDAEVFLGLRTGLGRPRGTPATLREYLGEVQGYAGPPQWLVLDAKGRVMRVVLDRSEPG